MIRPISRRYYDYVKGLLLKSSYITDIVENLDSDKPYIEVFLKEGVSPSLYFRVALAYMFGSGEYSLMYDKVHSLVINVLIEDDK